MVDDILKGMVSKTGNLLYPVKLSNSYQVTIIRHEEQIRTSVCVIFVRCLVSYHPMLEGFVDSFRFPEGEADIPDYYGLHKHRCVI